MVFRFGLPVAALVLFLLASVAALRVSGIQGGEVHALDGGTLDELMAARRLDDGVRVVEAHLARDQEVAFELCAEDPLLPERWRDRLTVAVRRRGGEVMTASRFDDETLGLMRRNDHAACLHVGHGVIGVEDDYTIDLLYDAPPPDALRGIPFGAEISAHHPLGGGDRAIVLALFGSSLLMLVVFLFRDLPARGTLRPLPVDPFAEAARELDAGEGADALPSTSPDRPPGLASRGVRLAVGFAMVLAGFFLTRYSPPSAFGALATGLGLASWEVSVGVALAPGPGIARRLDWMGLGRPRFWFVHLPLAVVAGVALVVLANVATSLVPSTGRSAVQAAVSWPSGMFYFAALAVVAPLAEEIFFRGFVFGLIAPSSRVLAFLGGWLLFVIAHVPQVYGQWGALVAITVTGLVLTSLRAASGSTLVSGVAHLIYNGTLAASALFAAG